MLSRIERLYTDEEGATMVEYALLLALIAVVSIAIVTLLGGQVGGTYRSVSGAAP